MCACPPATQAPPPTELGLGLKTLEHTKPRHSLKTLPRIICELKTCWVLPRTTGKEEKQRLWGLFCFCFAFFFLNLGTKHKPLFWKTGWLQYSTMELTSQWPLPPSDPSQMNLMLAIAKIDVLVSYKKASGLVQCPGTFSKHNKMSGVCVCALICYKWHYFFHSQPLLCLACSAIARTEEIHTC